MPPFLFRCLRCGCPRAVRVPGSGVAAVDPTSGLAIQTWSPAAPTKTGGKVILPVSNGVWFGSDSTNFGAEKHYGIAFAPLR